MFAGIDTSAVYADGSAAADEGRIPSLGTVIFNQNKWYKLVKYAHGTGTLDLAVGDVVYYVDDSGYGTHTVTADVSDSTGQEIGAGVATAVVTENDSYFWVQIKGAATLAVALGGSAADGDPLSCVGAADKALARAIEADTAGVYKPVVAIAVDATAKEIICDFPW